MLLPAIGYVAYGAAMDGDPHPQPLMIGWHSYASIAVAIMLVVCMNGTRVADRLLATLPLRLLGRISYGLYLWHLPVLMWLQADGSIAAAGGPLAFALYGLLFSLVAALASWWFVERPALRLASRWPMDAHARMPTPVSVRAP
jgi:peptidoglycan/LPS O-acetylase OafA/YrhL